MSYPINYPTPQGANIQTFYAGSATGTQTWIKPQGASFIWFTLIGAGEGGISGVRGGGSGAVTNCLVPAFLIPDDLQIIVGVGGVASTGGTNTQINYTSKATYNLLTANGAASQAATASSSNYFSAMGLFQSIAGQNGTTTAVAASATTFLGGGGYSTVTGNYGYSVPQTSAEGFFQLQPIIVGLGGTFSTLTAAGIGCGGGSGGNGGNGLVVIISW